MRLKNRVVNAKVLENTIENCGIHDFDFESEKKNGEGIYIGTSNNQVVPSTAPHVSALCTVKKEPDDTTCLLMEY